MAPAFKTVVMLLASFQFTQQASLSSDFYDSKTVFGPLNNKLTFHSSFDIPTAVKSESAQYEPVKSDELKSLNADRGSASNFRSKRQVNQDLDSDAEIISNDPDMFSHGKSMPMTTDDDDDDTHKLSLDEHENISWNNDMNSDKSNLLAALEPNLKRFDETSKEEENVENSESKTQKSSFLSTTNDALSPVITTEEKSDGSSPNLQQDDSEIHIVPTINYEVPFSEESDLENNKKVESLETSTQPHDDAHINNDEESNVTFSEKHFLPNQQHWENADETNLQTEENMKRESSSSVEVEREDNSDLENNMKTNKIKDDEIEIPQNEKQLNNSNAITGVISGTDDFPIASEGIEKRNGTHEIESKELFIDSNEAELNNYEDDTEMFDHSKPGNSDNDASLSQLVLLDNSATDEEGSGDIESEITGSHETDSIHDINDANGSNNNSLLEEMSSDTNNSHINIDHDNIADKTIQGENEDESPISDPTLAASKIHDSSKTTILSGEDTNGERNEESPIPEPTENSSNVDLSQTYDPDTIVNPFNIDNPSELSKTLGKALGMIDNYEVTTENEGLEGSGQSFVFQDTEFDKDSLEDGAMFKLDPRTLHEEIEDHEETTTNKDDDAEEGEVTELPIVIKHHAVNFNPPQTVSSNDDNLVVTQNSMSTDDTQEITTESGVVTEIESVLITSTELPFETYVDTAKISDTPKEYEEQISYSSSRPDNDNGFPILAGINEIGIKNDIAVDADNSTDSTSSSSTGSFIVLGAIMATIVLLLGYSVIKSRREKQRNLRRPPEDDQGTELKEIETLLSEKNGHGPANGSNVESGRLLNVIEENDTIDLKSDDTFPKCQTLNEKNALGNQLNIVPKIEEPNSLSEVKVNTSNAVPPVNKQVANGVSLKNSPSDHSRPLNEPNSLSTDGKASSVHGIKPEPAKIKVFTDHDSIPKTPIVIVRRGPSNVEM